MDQELRKRWQENVDEHFSMQFPSSLDTQRPSPSTLDSFKPSSWYQDPGLLRDPDDAPQSGDDTFQLLEKIGQGGMGIVYKARQRSLGRRVAVKKLHPKRKDQRDVERALFEAEAHTAGLLDHPNIVPIYDLNETPQGDLFLAMKLVGGRSWRELLWERPKDLERHLEILLQVCNAVAFAHSREIVHNDLKPSNVMVGSFGEVLLMDWGLAVSFADHAKRPPKVRHISDITGPCGTPAYCPPELAEGRWSAIGPTTDTYLLGALLYEAICRTPPHPGDKFWDVVARAAQGEVPSLPETVNPELRAICTRALALEPELRFPSVAEFQQALRDHLQHKESLAVSDAARTRLDACVAAAERAEEAQPSDYDGFAQAIAGFTEALRLWPGNQQAEIGLVQARQAYAGLALRRGDLGVTQTQLGMLQGSAETLREQPDLIAGSRQLREQAQEAQRKQDRDRKLRKILAVATIASVLVALIGLSLGMVIGESKNQELLRKNTELDSAYLALREINEQLIEQNEVAEERGKIAHGLLADIYVKIQERLLTDVADERSRILAHEFLDLVLQGWESLRSVDDERSSAVKGIAHMYYGDLLVYFQGEHLRSVAEYEESLRIFREVISAGTENWPRTEIEDLMFRCREKLSHALATLGRAEESRDISEKTIDRALSVLRNDPENYNAAVHLATARMNIAGLLIDAGGDEDAATYYGLNIDLLRDFCEIYENDWNLLLALCWNLRLSGRLLQRRRDIEAALGLCQESVEIAQQLVVDDPFNFKFNNGFGLALSDLATVVYSAGNLNEAINLTLEAIFIYRKQLKVSPGNQQILLQLVYGLIQIGHYELELGQEAKATASFEEAIDVSASLVRTDEAVVDYHAQLGAALMGLAEAYEQGGKFDVVAEILQDARDVLSRFPILHRDLRKCEDAIQRIGDQQEAE